MAQASAKRAITKQVEYSKNTIRNGTTRLSTRVVELMQFSNQSLSQATQQGWKWLTQQLISERLPGSEKAKEKSDGNRNNSDKMGRGQGQKPLTQQQIGAVIPRSEKPKAKSHENRTNSGQVCVRARPELTHPKTNGEAICESKPTAQKYNQNLAWNQLKLGNLTMKGEKSQIKGTGKEKPYVP